MTRPLRLRLLNPNTNAATTAMMTALANQEGGGEADFTGQTMASGPAIITDETALHAAAAQIEQAGMEAERACFDGVLIAGFGDPGLLALRDRVAIPVTGIAEAGMGEAGAAGRRFSIVTTTPRLKLAIFEAARRYGHGDALVSVRITPGDPLTVMSDAAALPAALLKLCEQAAREDGAQAIVIGGGPLAAAARIIAGELAVPIVEPIAAGARLAMRRALRQRRSARLLDKA